jgi:hypothetical protein
VCDIRKERGHLIHDTKTEFRDAGEMRV